MLVDAVDSVVAAVFVAVLPRHRLVMSTASFHGFAMKSGELYSYGVAGIPGSFASGPAAVISNPKPVVGTGTWSTDPYSRLGPANIR